MISKRPYRESITPTEACTELERHAEAQFDPEVVHIFMEEVMRNPPTAQQDTTLTQDPEL